MKKKLGGGEASIQTNKKWISNSKKKILEERKVDAYVVSKPNRENVFS